MRLVFPVLGHNFDFQLLAMIQENGHAVILLLHLLSLLCFPLSLLLLGLSNVPNELQLRPHAKR